MTLASLLFGGVVILGKVLAQRDVPVPPMLAVRFALAAAILAVGLALSSSSLRPAPGEWWRLLLLGGVGYATESMLFFLGLRHGSAAAVTLLFFTYPVWVALASAALGMGLPGRLVGGSLVAAMAGAGIVVGSSGGLEIAPAGVGFAMGSAVAFAVYLVGVERLVTRTPSPAAAMWVSASAAAGLALVAVATSSVRVLSGAGEWIPVTGMGVFTAGAFLCLFVGLRRLGAVRTSVVASLEPVATALLALLFLGERLRAGTVVGGLLILVAAMTASVARQGVAEAEAPTP